ncbi:MAG: right-handed parallel beta-helix repeat-containing protein [Ignavibacteriales bacterium]|nr:right-handed parallel beta-helix repeat-containing protein [Ignavibacteriales bacterium]
MKLFLAILFFNSVSFIFADHINYNVVDFGAKRDGITDNTEIINSVIETASKNGGGTIYFPAGDYLSFTIRLKSKITIYLEQGARLIANKETDTEGYDLPEENAWYKKYQDFGHSYWKNSLIFGDSLHDISIMGNGTIWGKGLYSYDKPEIKGSGNKAVGLKNCVNVTIKDISILHGGHFCILATGVDNLTINNVRADADRDGFDIDCCKNVIISDCLINSPTDDGLCLKSSFALGYARFTENVTITNCQIFGFDHGSLLNGTFTKEFKDEDPNVNHCITGRLKFGTESNGGFRNIAVSNCVFEHSRGFCLESADGGIIEDIVIDNITMRDITDTPFFIRLNARMRGPENVPIGVCRRISISNLNVYDVGGRPKSPELGACMIMGIPEHYIEDLSLSNIRIYFRGGGKKESVDKEVPQNIDSYPDPYRWNAMPAYGFYFRYVKGLKVKDIIIKTIENDERPGFVLDNVNDAEFINNDISKTNSAINFIIKKSQNIILKNIKGIRDSEITKTEYRKF